MFSRCIYPCVISLYILMSLLNYSFASSWYLQSGLQRLEDYPQPFWLALFVEGTRFTQAKLLAAQEYAASAGLPVPRNVLIPRTKVRFSLLYLFLLLNYTFSSPFDAFIFIFILVLPSESPLQSVLLEGGQKIKNKNHKSTVLRYSQNNH